MALTTRVWSAGKLLLLAGALLLTYVVFAAVGMRVALKTREVLVPLARREDRERGDGAPDRGRLNLKVEEGRRLDPKVPAGQIVTQDPAAGVQHAARAQREGLGQRRAALDWSCRRWRRVGADRRSCGCSRKDSALGAVAEIRSADYPAGTIVAQSPAPKTPAPQVALLVNRGERGARYVMPDLIGVNGDRAADLLRARGFRATVVGDHPYPGVAAGHRPAAEPAGRIPDCAGRADLARGQP